MTIQYITEQELDLLIDQIEREIKHCNTLVAKWGELSWKRNQEKKLRRYCDSLRILEPLYGKLKTQKSNE